MWNAKARKKKVLKNEKSSWQAQKDMIQYLSCHWEQQNKMNQKWSLKTEQLMIKIKPKSIKLVGRNVYHISNELSWKRYTTK